MKVSIEALEFVYPSGLKALDGVDLAVESGSRLGIVGQNGAGKTTLVRHLNGIFQPKAGTVRIGDWETTGRDIADLAARVGYVFQNPDEQLFARTVAGDVSFGPRNLGVAPERIDEVVAQSLERVGLAGEGQTHPYHLSLSERKRVALASVLAMDTPIVVLDEPTTGQDARGVAMIERIVTELNDEGRTVIAITHDMDFCAETFDRVVVMAQGRILADGAPAEVFREAEALDAARVEPPQLTRLSAALGWTEPVLTVGTFVDRLRDEERA
ncbi:MAG: energy-coupling factor ABC transporter ATP-binding protein [Salinibacterium sp.]|nr:energy-coupling factor ABC transporter ATP-binding protein [Salinibacterium sp.]